MAAETVHDLEHRFVVGGKVYIVQVCSPIPGSAAPESTGAFEVQIVTMAADDRATVKTTPQPKRRANMLTRVARTSTCRMVFKPGTGTSRLRSGTGDLEPRRDLERVGRDRLAVLDGHGKVLYSQKSGEFEAMRRMDESSVSDFLNQWKPGAAVKPMIYK